MSANKTDQISDNDFLAKARPKLTELEGVRVQKFKTYNFRKKIAAPIAAVLTPLLGFIDYWLIMLQSGNDDTAAGLTIVGLASLWGWVTKPKRDYAKAYKSKILPDIAALFGSFTYDVKGKIDMDIMKPSKIIPNHTQYSSEDLFSGNYLGTDIQFSEIKLKRKSGKSTVTVFDGLAILLSHGTRKFYGHTILTKDQGKIGSWLKKQFGGLKRANMADVDFERLFDVYTNDQTEARYLIDPIIIENLKTLYLEYHGNNLLASFYDDRVLILIGSPENHFEPADISVPATNETELVAMKHEIRQILSIVDRLSLYDPRERRKAER